jgi:hypothetical protein
MAPSLRCEADIALAASSSGLLDINGGLRRENIDGKHGRHESRTDK